QLGRSLRWKPQPRGERFDLRRTLRASLRTGGDLLQPHTLGHPLRNPRFVLLLDGSRSMSEHAPRMLQFAYALCERTRRARAFLFSTELREITRALHDAARARSYRLDDLGEAWGGGTRIGASLSEFVREHGASLSDQTFAIVISDGLDVGEIPRLARAMREIARRCAAVAWVNPHAGRPGYTPSARGMRAALPYLTSLTSFERMAALSKLGRRVRVTNVA
ncbi:MAG: VWA domain-containing protein, partial [Candidatus Cybelea sp.]